jgi:hypothetical protein
MKRFLERGEDSYLVPVSSPIQDGKGPLTWQFAMKSASRLRRDAKQLGRGRGVKSLPPVREKKKKKKMKMKINENQYGNKNVNKSERG